jgi:hypothetical protein
MPPSPPAPTPAPCSSGTEKPANLPDAAQTVGLGVIAAPGKSRSGDFRPPVIPPWCKSFGARSPMCVNEGRPCAPSVEPAAATDDPAVGQNASTPATPPARARPNGCGQSTRLRRWWICCGSWIIPPALTSYYGGLSGTVRGTLPTPAQKTTRQEDAPLAGRSVRKQLATKLAGLVGYLRPSPRWSGFAIDRSIFSISACCLSSAVKRASID